MANENSLQTEIEAAKIRVEALLDELLPVKGARFALQGPFDLDEAKTKVKERGIFGTLGLMTMEPDGSIRDLKQQEVLLIPAPHAFDLDRVEAYLRGWVASLGDWFEVLDVSKVEVCMPSDFADHRILDRKRPKTADDFRASFRRRWKIA